MIQPREVVQAPTQRQAVRWAEEAVRAEAADRWVGVARVIYADHTTLDLIGKMDGQGQVIALRRRVMGWPLAGRVFAGPRAARLWRDI